MSAVTVCARPSAMLCPYRGATVDGKVMCAKPEGEACPASLADVLASGRKDGGMSGKICVYDALEALLRAENLLAERGRTYDATFGEAPHEARERSMARTVAAFNALHGTQLTEAQGWSFMLCLKLVRLFCAPGFHADSADDAVAYAALLGEGKAREGDA